MHELIPEQATIKKEFPCNYGQCCAGFESKLARDYHRDKKHKPNPKHKYDCVKDFGFFDARDKYWHCSNTNCPIIYSSESGMKQHYNKVHAKKSFDCPERGCAKRFWLPTTLNYHIKTVHKKTNT